MCWRLVCPWLPAIKTIFPLPKAKKRLLKNLRVERPVSLRIRQSLPARMRSVRILPVAEVESMLS